MTRKQQVVKSIDGVTPLSAFKNQKKKSTYIKLRKSYLVYVLLGIMIISVAALVLIRVIGGHQNQNNVEVVKKEIARHMVLPTNEQPALATITDNKKLTTQFLNQTKNGDKLLIYQTNKKVIIYRPSIDRIIDIGPVSIDNAPASPSQ